MSRLTFDDLLKTNTPLRSDTLHATAKNRALTESEKASSFDNTFKQAVEELQPRENFDDDEEPREIAARNTNQSSSSSEKEENKRAASDREETERIEKESEKSEATDKNASESDDQNDPDDALIAMVMATAREQAEAIPTGAEGEMSVENLGETAADTGKDSSGNLLENATLDPDENLSDSKKALADNQETAAEILETTIHDTFGNATETSGTMTEDIVVNGSVASQEGTSSLENINATTLQGEVETAGTKTSPYNTDQQGETNQDQGSGSEGGGDAQQEVALPETLQASMADAALGQGEESTTQSADAKKETTDVAVKSETVMDRLAATTTETRSGSVHGTSNHSTQPTAETTLDTTDRVRFIERVTQAFQSQAAENRAVRMRLHPEELGEIKLEMTVRNGAMHAKIETETREARNVLMDNLPALRERLASHDIKIEQFDIHYNADGDQQGTPHSPDDWSNSGRKGSNRSSNNSSSTTETDAQNETPTRQAVSLTGSGEQLDMTA